MAASVYDQLLAELARERRVRVRVAGICIADGRLLVQEDVTMPDGPMGFPGGGLTHGRTLQQQLIDELDEELGATVRSCEHILVLERGHQTPSGLAQSMEHYFRVELENWGAVRSREPHLTHHWVEITDLKDIDVRPVVVRDLIAAGTLDTVRHIVDPDWNLDA